MKVWLARNLHDNEIPETIHLTLDTAKMSVKAQIAWARILIRWMSLSGQTGYG